MDKRRKFGNQGEQIAAAYLTERGLLILETQVRTPYGEIDIIARDGDEIVFVEVKARRTLSHGYPEESVNEKKLEKILASADHVAQERKWNDCRMRVDIVSILFEEDKKPTIKHIPNITFA